MDTEFNFKKFIFTTLIVSIWIHVSEVFRYFVFVIPKIQSFLDHKAGITEMNWTICSIWGLWDMLLTALTVFMFWLCAQTFGNDRKRVFVSATFSWLFFFVLFWVGSANMGTSPWHLLLITLPLSWLEMFVACGIAARVYRNLKTQKT